MDHLRFTQAFGLEQAFAPAVGLLVTSVGFMFLLAGYRLYKLSFVVGGFMVGAYFGLLAANALHLEPRWIVLCGGVLIGLLAWPLTRVVVFLFAGLVFGSALSEIAGIALPSLADGVFLVGFVTGGILSFVATRLLAVLSTSLAGASAVFFGALSMASWLWAPLGDLPARHALFSMVIILLLFSLGCAVQLRIFPAQRTAEEG